VTRLRLGVAVLLCLAANACGGDDDGPPSQESIEGELATLFDRASPDTPEGADCVAERLAAAYTPDELVEARLLTEQYRAPGDMPRQLARPDAEAWVDASTACVDYIAVAGRTYAEDAAVFDEEVYGQCVDEHLDGSAVRDALVDSYSGKATSDAVVRMSTVLIACAEQQK